MKKHIRSLGSWTMQVGGIALIACVATPEIMVVGLGVLVGGLWLA